MGFAGFRHSAGGFAGNSHSAEIRVALWQISANTVALRRNPANPIALWSISANPPALLRKTASFTYPVWIFTIVDCNWILKIGDEYIQFTIANLKLPKRTVAYAVIRNATRPIVAYGYHRVQAPHPLRLPESGDSRSERAKRARSRLLAGAGAGVRGQQLRAYKPP